MTNLESLAIRPDVYYTVEETAQLLRVSRQTALRLLRTRQVRGLKVGRKWRILGKELLDLSPQERSVESSLVGDWLDASKRSLAEVWDNAEDAVYDHL